MHGAASWRSGLPCSCQQELGSRQPCRCAAPVFLQSRTCALGDDRNCNAAASTVWCTCSGRTAAGTYVCNASTGNKCALPLCPVGSAHLCRASGSSPQACRCVGSSAAGSYVCGATSNTCVLPVCSSGGGNCRTGSFQTCRCTLTGHTCNSSGSCVVSFSRCGLPRAVSGQQFSLQRQPGHDCQHRICTPCMAVGQCPTRAFGILPLPTPGLHAYHCTAEYVPKQHQRR